MQINTYICNRCDLVFQYKHNGRRYAKCPSCGLGKGIKYMMESDVVAAQRITLKEMKKRFNDTKDRFSQEEKEIIVNRLCHYTDGSITFYDEDGDPIGKKFDGGGK